MYNETSKEKFEETSMSDLPIGVNAILINEKGEILLGKRKNAFGDGEFSLIGGHLKDGERIEACIVRELWEEVGLKVLEEDVEVVNFAFVGEGIPMIEIGAVVKKYEGVPTIKEPLYCEKIGFFRLEELPKIFVGTRVNLELYLKGKFY